MTTVVVIGASGFIGEHLLNALVERKDIDLRVLVHRNRARSHPHINFIEGDLLQPDSLDALLSKGCTVINLAYLFENNIDAMVNLANTCAKTQVRRLIHCSTAVVDGRARDDFVTETTPCVPVSNYEQTKLRMENTLLDAAIGKFEVSILRPTAVFGRGGQNLRKLMNELISGNRWINYIRSCLFNRRSMNLVCVENVVAALIFLTEAENIDREIFIISDDDSPVNTYRDVEDCLLKNLGESYAIPRVFVPKFLLGLLLRMAGKSNTNPSKIYSDKKLAAFGFIKPQNLEAAINKFARWSKVSIQLKA